METPKQSRSTKYRRKVKETDPEKYQLYLEKQRQHMRRNRNTLKMELGKGTSSCDAIAKKQHQNELQRSRQKRCREKCKAAGKISANGNEKLSAKKRTRAAIQLMRAYNREAKIKTRAKMTSQIRAWYRKKDRKQKAALRQQRKQQDCQKENEYKPFPSKKTEYNITTNARKNLPQTPEKFNIVMQNLSRKIRSPQPDAEVTPDLPTTTLKQSKQGKRALKK